MLDLKPYKVERCPDGFRKVNGPGVLLGSLCVIDAIELAERLNTAFQIGFDSGAASRDSEVEILKSELANLRARLRSA